jgi:endonuclease/exonuclease/phosphatase family metal-dependent hydrolase
MGALPRSVEAICTQDIRNAAFYILGRANENASASVESASLITGPPTLRIMTYNVHGCMGRDGKISPNRIAGIITKHNLDIIALQEVGANDQADQTEIIARKLGMNFCFNPTFTSKKGQRGNALFSKFPMRLVRNGSLPRLSRVPFLEPRGALWVEIDRLGQKVQVFNTHLSLSSLEGFMQIKALCGPDWIGNHSCQNPVVFCGDLNALSHSKICKHIGQLLKNTHSELNNGCSFKTLPSF